MWVGLLVACHAPADDGSPAETSPPGTLRLTVTSGFGGGSFAAGTTVHAWADVDPQAQIVTGWTGADLDPADEWNASLVMPDHDVTLTPAIATGDTTLEERTYTLAAGQRRVLGHFTPSPHALVLFFHGASYSVEELRDNAASTIRMQLVRAGDAVVAVPSETETRNGTGGWNAALTSNPDLENVRALVDALRADGTVTASTPVFAWGMSSGGYFAHTVGAALPADAVVAYCAPGSSEAIAATHAPTAWYLAAADRTIPTSVEDATAFQSELAARQVPTDLYVHPATPVYDQRFERVTGVDAARSAAIAASVRATGAPDPADLDGLSDAQRTAIEAEIEIMAADHELYDDVASRMVAFLASH